MSDRSLWPWFAWPAGLSLIGVFLSTGATAFGDSAWWPFILLTSLTTVVFGITTAATAADKVTYRSKPRGWRKMRADAEREAYIRDLERELKNQ